MRLIGGRIVRILIVDHKVDFVRQLSSLLKTEEHEVLTALEITNLMAVGMILFNRAAQQHGVERTIIEIGQKGKRKRKAKKKRKRES